MRARAFMVAVAAAVIAGLLSATAAVAATGGTASGSGGTSPTPRSGGTTYGSALPKPDRRPVAVSLALSPRSVTATGQLPRISFRVRQRGIQQVRARIALLRMPRNRGLTSIALGWVHTDQTVTVRLPGGLALRKGRYLVRLHVTDSRGHRLRRSRKRPGRAVITVHAAPPAAVAPGPVGPVALLPPPAPSPGGPGVFPVAGPFDFGGAGARFGAGRPGHIHEGQDIIAAEGIPVVAPYAGRISATRYQESGAGEYVVLDALDGRDYFFAHCVRGSTAVAEGAAVFRGQRLCRVGSTGTASGPHLHFEIWNVGWRVAGGYPIDPLPELRAWSGR